MMKFRGMTIVEVVIAVALVTFSIGGILTVMVQMSGWGKVPTMLMWP